MRKLCSSIVAIATLSQIASASAGNLHVRAVAELGFLSVLDHKVQFSKSGTYFDYNEDGGQDVLFAFSRLSLELGLNSRNSFILLYQPLSIQTQESLGKPLSVDSLLFPAGTNVKFLYDFPFYRVSYLREFLSENELFSLAAGLSLQIRNATISFESLDGSRYRTTRDVGPVPALKLRTSWHPDDLFWVTLEADGIYAPVSYLNGSDEEIVGSILDASLRSGIDMTSSSKAFVNIRYLGGGAVGTDSDDEGPGDGYVKNWLHFLTVSAGLIYEFAAVD
ncbi:MAG: hypothetical protein GF398_00100 [Chitinivibrionales bacterium]|nr:hypothetical protein [Chitinivibrionales bacterium]